MKPSHLTQIIVSPLFIVLILVGLTSTSWGQITPDQRRELLTLNKEVGKVAGLVRKKEFEEAGKLLDEIEKKVEEIATAASLEKTDRALAGPLTAIARQRTILEKAMGGGKASEKVSFVEDVAPLINSKCLGCHGNDNPRAGLNLTTFNGWRNGGRSGALLAIGAPNRSLIVARLTAPAGQGKMPQRGTPLTDEEVGTVQHWIAEGARFDGNDLNRSLADLIFEHEQKTLNIEIPKPKGTETVSFTEDIAPFMSRLCLGCHNENRRSGGLSLATFYDMMKGGDSGEVIHPGDMENSRLYRLTGGLELPRMPQGQARITRQNYEDLKKWFMEGNTFDGADPRAPITSYVKSTAQMMAEEFASKSEAEMKQLRETRSAQQIKSAVPNDATEMYATENFYMVGNVSRGRLQEVEAWADEHLATLKKLFGGDGKPWRGGLAIFVLKDRFSYDEFNEVVERRRAEKEMVGHIKVTGNQEDAYIVLQDLGDDATGKSLKLNLIEHLTGAYLTQNGSTLPAWLVQGTGLYLAMQTIPGRQHTHELRTVAASLVPTLPRPEDVFDAGAFSPATIGPIGYSLVDYLLESAGPQKFARLVQALQRGQDINAALQAAYGANAMTVSRSFSNSLK